MHFTQRFLKVLCGSPSHSWFTRYSVNVGWNLVAGVSGFATVVLVGRIHGTEALGYFALAQSLLIYGEVFTHWGFGPYAIAHVAPRPRMLVDMVRSVIRLRIPLAVTAYAFLCALTGFVPDLRGAFGLTAIMGLVVFVRALSPAWAAQALHQTGVFVAINYIAACLTLPLMGLAYLVSPNIHGVAVAILVANLIALAGAWVWLRTQCLARDLASEPPPPLLTVFRASSPIGFARLFRGLSFGLDLLLVGLFLSAEETGHYTAAYKVFLFMLSLVYAYFVILFPRMATSAARSREDVLTEFRTSLVRTLPWVLAACIGMSIIAAPFMRIVFGPEFLAAVPVLRWLQVVILAVVIHTHCHQVLLVLGKQKLDMKLTITAGVFHIVLKALLIPRLGLVGAAVGGVLAEVGLVLAHAWFIRRVLAEPPHIEFPDTPSQVPTP